MKLISRLAILTVLVSALGLSAQEAAAPLTNPYYPLKQGSTWTYTVQGGPVQVKVAGTEKIKDATAYKLETTAGGKVSATETVGVTKDGVVRYQVNGVSAAAPILFLKADAKKGDSWTIDTTAGMQTIKGTYKVSEEKIKVNGKDYDTLHVKGEDLTVGTTKTNVEYWFAKDVGIVKLKFTLGSQDATLELENYTAGK